MVFDALPKMKIYQEMTKKFQMSRRHRVRIMWLQRIRWWGHCRSSTGKTRHWPWERTKWQEMFMNGTAVATLIFKSEGSPHSWQFPAGKTVWKIFIVLAIDLQLVNIRVVFCRLNGWQRINGRRALFEIYCLDTAGGGRDCLWDKEGNNGVRQFHFNSRLSRRTQFN